jgi:hypothetical protein
MSKLVWNSNNIQLWASGYTSDNDKYNIPAILKVKTMPSNSTYTMEAITLPAIPLQKWTVITIVKEGRRFDVYYGAQRVQSKVLTNVPESIKATGWNAGNSAWRGQVGLFKGFAGVRTTQDVESDMSALLDTTGKPKLVDALKFDLKSLSMPCLLGNCNNTPNSISPNPYTTWTSSMV